MRPVAGNSGPREFRSSDGHFLGYVCARVRRLSWKPASAVVGAKGDGKRRSRHKIPRPIRVRVCV